VSTHETVTVVLAAGPVFGSLGMSGLAMGTGLTLLAGLRKSDRVKLNRDKAAGLGIAMGTFGSAAGDMWKTVTHGIAEVPSALVQGSVFGNVGLGASALGVTLVAFLFKWDKMLWPSLLGISAGVIYGQAGGLWSVANNVVLKIAAGLGAL
jgi:hypothetical protein